MSKFQELINKYYNAKSTIMPASYERYDKDDLKKDLLETFSQEDLADILAENIEKFSPRY